MKNTSGSEGKNTIFKRTENHLTSQGFHISRFDKERPWGGFFAIEESETARFMKIYFPDVNPDEFSNFNRLSPKILLVAPDKRLSWQYHHRRAEIWRVVEGPVGVVVSDTDALQPAKVLPEGETIRLRKGERHRLLGLENWGIVAEIWQHTDPQNPSDEEDIIRLEDDFGRD